MQNENQNLTPTVPTNQDIFNQSQVSTSTDSVKPQIDKKGIIATHGGGRKLPTKYILIALGGVVLLLLLTVMLKTIITRTTGTQMVTLNWWGLEEDSEAVTPLINEYKQTHPNVDVIYKKEDSQDYRERLLNSLAQGKGPDIFEFHNTWVPMFNGSLSPTKTDYSSAFYPVVSSDLKSKSGFLGVPLEYNGIALFVNQDILTSFGKNIPKTWDDFATLSQLMTLRDTKGSIQQAGAAMGVTGNIDYWQDIFAVLALQNGGRLETPANGTGVQNALTFYTNFSKFYRVWDETLPSSSLDFVNGRLAMYFGKYEDVFKIKKQNPNLHFSVNPLPQLPTNSSTIPSVSYASYWVNGVAKNSANKDVAWDFLNFMTQASSLKELYSNEQKVKGYGNLYPRVDMQNDLLTDPNTAAFIYQASFAQSWYMVGGIMDGPSGINTLIAKPYADVIEATSGTGSDKDLTTSQNGILTVLSQFGLATLPKATP